MKTKLLFLIFAIMLSGVVYAQDRQQNGRQGQGQRLTVEERAKSQADRLKTNLNLTDVQYDSVKKIQLRFLKKTEDLRRGQTAEAREAITKSREDVNKEMKKVLTAEQYKKYEESNRNRRSRENSQRPTRNN